MKEKYLISLTYDGSSFDEPFIIRELTEDEAKVVTNILNAFHCRKIDDTECFNIIEKLPDLEKLGQQFVDFLYKKAKEYDAKKIDEFFIETFSSDFRDETPFCIWRVTRDYIQNFLINFAKETILKNGNA